MADWFMGRDFLAIVGEAIVRGGTPPSSTGYHLILCSTDSGGGDLTAQMTATTVVGFEVAATNGYTRKNYAPAGGTFDTVQRRYEFPSVPLTFSAVGGSIVFNSWALLANSTSTRGNTTGTLALFYNYPTQQTILAGDDKVITLEGWNFVRATSALVGAES